MDNLALYVAEIDDFKSERREVLQNQGAAIPFSKGFWLLCQLAGAINPDDLDNMDEKKPFSKTALSNLMGRQLTDQEFQYYLDQKKLAEQKYHQPNQQNYQPLYSTNNPSFYKAPNQHQFFYKKPSDNTNHEILNTPKYNH